MFPNAFRGTFVIALVGLALLASSGQAVQQVDEAAAPDRVRPAPAAPVEPAPNPTAELRRLLAQPTDKHRAGFLKDEPLKDILEVMRKSHSIQIRFDDAACRTEGIEPPDNLNLPRDIPPYQQMPPRVVLQDVLAPFQLTYLVKGRVVVIVPLNYARLSILEREYVDLEFEKKALSEALAELSDQTGVTILLDSKRAGQKCETPITAVMQQASLQNAVRLLADMASLKAVFMGNTVYVTTPENAKALVEEGTATTAPQGGAAAA